MCSFAENNPHPARGRKAHPDSSCASAVWRNNPHPARGRKRCRYSSLWNLLGKQPTPRKGTETRSSAGWIASRMIGNNPHPARGRKHQLLALDLHPVCLETTHTPQGDGNQVASTQQFLLATWKQPAPRKGTETFRRSCSACPRRGRNNPHPARGRKLADLQLAGRDDLKHLHPQGDGNAMTMSFHSISLEPIYTPQGDGNTPFMYLSKYVTETLHTPQGDRKPCHCCIFCFT